MALIIESIAVIFLLYMGYLTKEYFAKFHADYLVSSFEIDLVDRYASSIEIASYELGLKVKTDPQTALQKTVK